MSLSCAGCGHNRFSRSNVIDAKLATEWELSPDEARYINEQQGVRCSRCGSNLRSIVLARAILRTLGSSETLSMAMQRRPFNLKVLEINEAGELTQFLRLAGSSYTFADYPAVDMQKLPFDDQAFDLIVHSDTLEHVPNPMEGLRECRRVLRPGGALCYTVPTVVGRMTRSRKGLPPSFHVTYPVCTEFGADAWTYPARAGFSHVGLECLSFPTAIAITAR
jgi:SAM-dependent methyltransferase